MERALISDDIGYRNRGSAGRIMHQFSIEWLLFNSGEWRCENNRNILR